jgi:hypothetical protein
MDNSAKTLVSPIEKINRKETGTEASIPGTNLPPPCGVLFDIIE